MADSGNLCPLPILLSYKQNYIREWDQHCVYHPKENYQWPKKKKKWKDIQLHIIREIQIKIKYLIFAHNTGQKEGKDFVIQCWQGLRRRRSPSKSVGVQIGTVIWAVIWAAIWHIHQILKYITLDLETPLLKMCPTESLPQSPKDVYMPKSVH